MSPCRRPSDPPNDWPAAADEPGVFSFLKTRPLNMHPRIVACLLAASAAALNAAEPIKLGFNYAETGSHAPVGAEQLRGAELALDEINAAGGVLGRPLVLVKRDGQAKADVGAANVRELIEKEGVAMIFGASDSATSTTVGKVALEKRVPYFVTLGYSTTLTREHANPFKFRECYDSEAAAKVLSEHLNKNHKGKKFFYITQDYVWGHSTEDAFRRYTGTTDTEAHKSVRVKFPGATLDDYKRALGIAKLAKPDVLVLVVFGSDMTTALREATLQGMKTSMAVVVPNLTLIMAEEAGARVMEGVVGALPWDATIPGITGSERGKAYVEAFSKRFNRLPCTSSANAYTILHEWAAAATRAGTIDGPAVAKALRGHTYTLLKDAQTWRDFDNQSVQTVYAVRCLPEAQVRASPFGHKFFEVIATMSGEDAFPTLEQWRAYRVERGLPADLPTAD